MIAWLKKLFSKEIFRMTASDDKIKMIFDKKEESTITFTYTTHGSGGRLYLTIPRSKIDLYNIR
jgi:hypothetical protein